MLWRVMVSSSATGSESTSTASTGRRFGLRPRSEDPAVGGPEAVDVRAAVGARRHERRPLLGAHGLVELDVGERELGLAAERPECALAVRIRQHGRAEEVE